MKFWISLLLCMSLFSNAAVAGLDARGRAEVRQGERNLYLSEFKTKVLVPLSQRPIQRQRLDAFTTEIIGDITAGYELALVESRKYSIEEITRAATRLRRFLIQLARRVDSVNAFDPLRNWTSAGIEKNLNEGIRADFADKAKTEDDFIESRKLFLDEFSRHCHLLPSRLKQLVLLYLHNWQDYVNLNGVEDPEIRKNRAKDGFRILMEAAMLIANSPGDSRGQWSGTTLSYAKFAMAEVPLLAAALPQQSSISLVAALVFVVTALALGYSTYNLVTVKELPNLAVPPWIHNPDRREKVNETKDSFFLLLSWMFAGIQVGTNEFGDYIFVYNRADFEGSYSQPWKKLFLWIPKHFNVSLIDLVSEEPCSTALNGSAPAEPNPL